MDEAIERFNEAASELQKTEFRLPKTPGEWERMHKDPPKRDYAKLLDAVEPLLEAFRSANPEERPGAAARLSFDARGILRTFAWSAALLAVRREWPALIAQGLTALAILGEVEDRRDLAFYLAPLHHSAAKLGVDAPKIFAEVASLSPSTHVRDQIRSFPLLPPQSRDLAGFRMRETTSSEGFDIVQER